MKEGKKKRRKGGKEERRKGGKEDLKKQEEKEERRKSHELILSVALLSPACFNLVCI